MSKPSPEVLAKRESALSSMMSSPTGIVGSVIVLVAVLAALFGPLLPLRDPLEIDLLRKLQPPSGTFLMGTDQAGRDIFSRVVTGTAVSLRISFVAVIVGTVIGTAIGLLAGFYARSLVEDVLMRAIEVLAAIPLLIWAIAVVGIIGVEPVDIGPVRLANEDKLALLVGILYVPTIARVVHAVARVEAAADYVKARRIQGTNSFTIIVSDILPNCLSPIVVQASLLLAVGIVIEASLSFIGLGVQPPTPSWGTMLADARNFVFTGEWWMPLFPGLAIAITVVGFNLCGDALRDALDPRLRRLGAASRPQQVLG
jgi:peptide/nickel transport system permease protein